jgi:hypothetical protein
MSTTAVEAPFEFVQPLGAGRLRGVLLHKLMEEFVTGELNENVDGVVKRATELLIELQSMNPDGVGAKPDPKESAETALRTLHIPEIVAIRSSLQAEVPIWAGSVKEGYLAGRADAVSVVEGRVQLVLDWKSDVAPSDYERSGYRGQLGDYLMATGAKQGALVYMTLGEIEWINMSDAPAA